MEKRYRDFLELQTQLVTLWPSLSELPFPPKHIAKMQPHVIEERIVALELFMRNCVSLFGVYSLIDYRCGQALRLVQEFLGLHVYVNVHLCADSE